MEETVIGIRDLRKNMADVIDKVTSRYDVITAEDKVRAGRRASIISTDMLKDIMDCYKMTGEIGWDEATQQFYAKVNEIEIDGVGNTQAEAVRMAMDNAEMAAENFFELAEMYMKVGKYREMYPYLLKIRLSDIFHVSLKETLGFQ